MKIAWEPDVWGRLRAQRAAARAGFQATALDYDWARQSLAATASQAWYQAVELRRLMAVNEVAVKDYQELLRLAKVKQTAGQVAGLDVAEASARLDLAQIELSSLQSLFIATQRNLEVLLGRYPAAEIDISRDFSPLPPPVQAGLPSPCSIAGPMSWQRSAWCWPRSATLRPTSWPCYPPSSSTSTEAASATRCSHC